MYTFKYNYYTTNNQYGIILFLLCTVLLIMNIEQGAAGVPQAMDRVQADDDGEAMDDDEIQDIL